MVPRRVFLGKLRKCLEAQLQVVGLCAKHEADESFFETMQETDHKACWDLLHSLKVESESHVKTLQELVGAVESADQDAF